VVLIKSFGSSIGKGDVRDFCPLLIEGFLFDPDSSSLNFINFAWPAVGWAIKSKFNKFLIVLPVNTVNYSRWTLQTVILSFLSEPECGNDWAIFRYVVDRSIHAGVGYHIVHSALLLPALFMPMLGSNHSFVSLTQKTAAQHSEQQMLFHPMCGRVAQNLQH